jgi:NADP-dependent 3-hydroxy acid dehydrogenase YdfG
VNEVKLENKVAIVTGASRGIGHSIAIALAKEGVDLTLFARSEEDLQQVAQEVRDIGRECITMVGDVSNPEDVAQAVGQTLEQFGKIDILVNNAGIGLFKTVRETTLEEWKNTLDVNLTGTFLFAKEVLGPMIERGQGQIVNISSDIGRRTIPRASAYCASKSGVQAFTDVLSKEVRKLGIKVGSILPGMTDSYFNNSDQGLPEKENWLKGDDVAAAVVYMCSLPRHALVDELTVHPIIQEY